MTYAQTCTALLLLTASACVGEFLDVGSNRAASTGTGGSTSSTGTGGALVCTPGSMQSCYGGPEGTEGKGICKAGAQECAADGMSWGECVGEVRPAVEDCASGVDQDCDGTAPACEGGAEWALGFGDASTQEVAGVAVDPSGAILMTGAFGGTVDFGGGPLESTSGSEIFLAKLDGTGAHIWSGRFGSGSGRGVATGSDGSVVIAGAFSGTVDFGGGPFFTTANEIFVAKLDAAGQHVWSKHFAGSSTARVTSIAVDASNAIVMLGDFAGAVDFGGGPLVAPTGEYITKLDPGGGHIWSRVLASSSTLNDWAESRAVVSGPAGVTVVAGTLFGTVQLAGSTATSVGSSDAFVVSLDAAGATLWSSHFGGSAAAADAQAVGVDSAGNVLVTGRFSMGWVDFGGGPLTSVGMADAYIAKLDPAGGHIWSRHFGTGAAADDASGRAVAADSAGNVILAGDFAGSVDFGGDVLASTDGADVFIAKLNPGDGGRVWARRAGAELDQRSAGVTTDGAGNIVLAGNFFGAINFGTGWLHDGGGMNVFVAKFAP